MLNPAFPPFLSYPTDAVGLFGEGTNPHHPPLLAVPRSRSRAMLRAVTRTERRAELQPRGPRSNRPQLRACVCIPFRVRNVGRTSNIAYGPPVRLPALPAHPCPSVPHLRLSQRFYHRSSLPCLTRVAFNFKITVVNQLLKRIIEL